MSSKWRSTSVKIFLILFFVCILLFAFSFVNHTSFTGKSFAEAYNLPIGQSMFAGDSVLDDREMIEVPLLSNPSFIIHEIATLDLKQPRGGYEKGKNVLSFGVQTDRYAVQLEEFAKILRGEIESPDYTAHDYQTHKVVLAAAGLRPY